ncbi:MAG: hypothetical protein R2831_01470 [Chitinophagaceae bacterium]
MESEIKLCLFCNKKLVGRADKKFCNDSCRNNYNNKQNDEGKEVKTIINALKKNRKILQAYLQTEDTARTTKSRLLESGFQFNYHTHTYENQKGNIYKFCFEYGYLSLDNDWFLIVSRKEK